MKIDIKATNLELTPAISAYIEEKIGGLDKFIHAGKDEHTAHSHDTVEAFVEIARTTMHHRHGDVFRAEVNLKVGGNVLRAEQEEWDVRVALDAVREELRTELQKMKGIRETKSLKGARLFKRLRSISPLAWFKKEKEQ